MSLILAVMMMLVSGSALALTVCVWGIIRARATLERTTLRSAWIWATATIALWTLVWIGTTTEVLSANMADPLWYAAALVGLCPAIAVLGARRPGAGVWSAFVILPLLAVLGWPILTVWSSDFDPRPLRLQAPALIGFVLVLLMGAGNYIGTRFSLPACLYAVALCLAVSPVSAVAPTWLQGALVARHAATLLLGLTVLIASRQRFNTIEPLVGFDRIWWDYRNMFGIVWAKRLQDRINGIGEQQEWSARLEPDGFVWQPEATKDDRRTTVTQIEQTLRWLLRRFVDPAWIDARLK